MVSCKNKLIMEKGVDMYSVDKKIAVYDTKIVSVSRRDAADGRSWAAVTIALRDVDYEPGQFMMIKTCDGDVRWGYAYLIQRADEETFTVLAPLRSDLYQQKPGNDVVVWGPRGQGALKKGDGSYILVAEPATYESVVPFLLAAPTRCRLLLLVGGDCQTFSQLLGEEVSLSCVDSVDSLCLALEGMDDGQILAALNPERMKEYNSYAANYVRCKTWMFMPTQIGCGIGACTGCVVHGKNAPFGIKVCEEGPFLLLNRVDIGADIHSFITRE